MNRLWKCLISSCVSLTFACFGMMIIGRTQPLPEIAGLELCGTRPCYLGIVVGETTWDQAKDIVANTPGWTLNPVDAHRSFIGEGSLVDHITAYHGANGIVFDMALTSHQPFARAGDIVSQLGSPCA